MTYGVELVGHLHQLLVHLDPNVLALEGEESETQSHWKMAL